MGLIMKLRQKGVAIIIFIALLAFLLGGLLRSGRIFRKATDYVAKINGYPIKYRKYQERIDQSEQFYKILENKSSLDPDLISQIQQQVWNLMVTEAVLKPSIEKLGITVSKEELWDMIQGQHISPIIKQIFVNDQGQFDKNLLIRFLKNKDQDQKASFLWLYIEHQIKEQRLYEKYNILATKALFANKLEAQDNYMGRKIMADLQMTGQIFFKIPDDSVKYTLSDLKNYYREHKKFFYQYQETRNLDYVVFEVLPSRKDSLDAYNYCMRLKKEFRNAEDDYEFIKLNAENPTYPRYYTAKELSDIGLDSSVMTLPLDTIIGPYLDGEYYKLAKIIDKAKRPDTVSAEHILISPQNPKVKTWDRAKIIADSLLNVIENGADFKTLALRYSDDPGVKQNGGVYENFTEGQMVPEFNEFCFSHKVGDIGVVKTQFGYHVVKILKQSPPLPKVKIALVDVKISISEDTYNAMYRIAGKFRTSCKDSSDFYKLAGEYKLLIHHAPGLNKGTMRIAGLKGNTRELVRWAFKVNEGDISDIKRFENKYVIALLVSVNPKGYQPFDKVKDRIITDVLIRKKVDYIYNQIKDKKASNIEELSKKLGDTLVLATHVSFNAYQVPYFGYEPALLARIPTVQSNKIYGAIKGKNGAYYFEVIKLEKPDKISPEVIEQDRVSLGSSYRMRAKYSLFDALKHRVEFIDNRPDFF